MLCPPEDMRRMFPAAVSLIALKWKPPNAISHRMAHRLCHVLILESHRIQQGNNRCHTLARGVPWTWYSAKEARHRSVFHVQFHLRDILDQAKLLYGRRRQTSSHLWGQSTSLLGSCSILSLHLGYQFVNIHHFWYMLAFLCYISIRGLCKIIKGEKKHGRQKMCCFLYYRPLGSL